MLASGFDGSGAGSVFALVKTGRLYAVASLLLKLGMGVRDAWVQRDLTKAQAGELLDELASQIELVPVSSDVLRRSLPHFLSVNEASGLLPPFGTLDVIETTGLGTVNPQQMSPNRSWPSCCPMTRNETASRRHWPRVQTGSGTMASWTAGSRTARRSSKP